MATAQDSQPHDNEKTSTPPGDINPKILYHFMKVDESGIVIENVE